MDGKDSQANSPAAGAGTGKAGAVAPQIGSSPAAPTPSTSPGGSPTAGGGSGSGGSPGSGMATGAIDSKIAGDGSSATRRYTGKAVGGGVEGAMTGGLQGAAAGAAKGVGEQAVRDVAGKVVSSGKSGSGELGAAGTSAARSEGNNRALTGIGVAGAAGASAPAAGMIGMAAFMSWLKSMFFAAVAAVLNGLSALLGFVVGAAKTLGAAIVAPFMAVGSAVAGTVGAALGIAVSASAAPIVAIGTGLTVAGVTVSLVGSLVTTLGDSDSLLDGSIGAPTSCAVIEPAAADGGEVGDAGVATEENAKIAYSVLRSWGMPEENIAGILGNWARESQIDPTSVEGIFDEPFRYGPRKQAAEASGFSHMGYVPISGIGLGQWTNDRNTLLINYAKSKNRPWHEIETQLAFMAKGDNPGDVEVFQELLSTSKGTPGEAAMFFHHNWERSADGAVGLAARQAEADVWFARMSSWEIDESVVGRIEELAGDVLGDSENVVASINSACSESAGGGSGAWDDRDGTTKPIAWGGYGNGKIPEDELTPLSWSPGDVLRGDAAADLELLNKDYRAKFGQDISITDSYRSYDEQVRIKAEKGVWAATPGYSNHGLAMALDLGGGINTFGSAEHEWMKANAPKYGWVHPPWAQVNGSLPEAWHWEYWGYPR